MTRLILVFLLQAPLLASAAAQTSTPGAVIEPRSGTPFPVSLIPPGAQTPHRLMGAAIRQRTIFKVKVYAFGLYVDPEGAQASLSRFAGVAPPVLQHDQNFYRRLLDLDFAMTLRLVMIRTVSGDDIADSFNQVLVPRVARASRGANGFGNPAALQQFLGYFHLDEVRLGTEIVISCAPAGRLTISVGSVQQPPIDSRTLCRALFDVYLGEDPISGEGKRNVIARFPELLATAPR